MAACYLQLNKPQRGARSRARVRSAGGDRRLVPNKKTDWAPMRSIWLVSDSVLHTLPDSMKAKLSLKDRGRPERGFARQVNVMLFRRGDCGVT